jgi:putative salt-induced outer membrane protein
MTTLPNPLGLPNVPSRRRRAPAIRCVAVVTLLASIGRPVHAQEAVPVDGWKLGGTVDASYVSATGNSQVTTVSVGDKLAATRGHWTLREFLTYVNAKTDSVESANQLHVGARAEYKITNVLSAFAGVTYERNVYAGFNRRLDELLGAQWQALAQPNDSVSFDGGGVITQQDNKDGTTDYSPSARAAGAYKHVFQANTFFSQSLEYVPNLKESGAYRLNSESAAVAPISTRISLKLGYVVQYNSHPPVGFKTTDRVFTSGLQVSF